MKYYKIEFSEEEIENFVSEASVQIENVSSSDFRIIDMVYDDLSEVIERSQIKYNVLWKLCDTNKNYKGYLELSTEEIYFFTNWIYEKQAILVKKLDKLRIKIDNYGSTLWKLNSAQNIGN